MFMGKPFVHPVADGTVVVKRRKHFANFVQYRFDASHVEKSLLLPSKRRIRQVFGGGRRAHRKRRLRIRAAECHKRRADPGLEISRKRLIFNHRADFSACDSQRIDVFGIELGQTIVDFLAQVAKLQELAECMRRRRKPGRHFDPRR